MAQDKYTRPDSTAQSGIAYKLNIDNGFETIERGVGIQFQAHEQTTPDMTVRLEAGTLWSGPGSAATSVAAQSTGTITAPVTNPRIDRIVVDSSTGAVSVITGSEAASPSAPSVTTGKIPIAYVTLATSTTSITDELITDERPTYIGDPTGGGSFLSNVVEDTTPQLGGNFNLNGNDIIDSNGNEMIDFTETASAVNHLGISNASTGNGVTLEAKGDDTNIDFIINSKGSGNFTADGLKYPNADGSANQVLKTDGAGNLSFATASGGMTLIETQTIASAVASVTLNTDLDQYTYILVHVDAYVPASASYPQLSISVDDGSTYESVNCQLLRNTGSALSAHADVSGTTADLEAFNLSSTRDMVIEVFNTAGATKLVRATITVGTDTWIGNVWVTDASKINHLFFSNNSGNISSAVFRVYGM